MDLDIDLVIEALRSYAKAHDSQRAKQLADELSASKLAERIVLTLPDDTDTKH